jgi:hypothetical protein
MSPGVRQALDPGDRRAGRSRSRHASAPRDRRWLDQVPYWVALGCVVAAVVVMRQDSSGVRGGTVAVGAVLLAAALARLVLPQRRAGMLASRRRSVDVAALASLGACLVALGVAFPVQ